MGGTFINRHNSSISSAIWNPKTLPDRGWTTEATQKSPTSAIGPVPSNSHGNHCSQGILTKLHIYSRKIIPRESVIRFETLSCLFLLNKSLFYRPFLAFTPCSPVSWADQRFSTGSDDSERFGSGIGGAGNRLRCAVAIRPPWQRDEAGGWEGWGRPPLDGIYLLCMQNLIYLLTKAEI